MGFNSAVDHIRQMEKMVPWGSSTRKPSAIARWKSLRWGWVSQKSCFGDGFCRRNLKIGAPKAEVPRYLLHVCVQFKQNKCFFYIIIRFINAAWNSDFIIWIYWSLFVMINYSSIRVTRSCKTLRISLLHLAAPEPKAPPGRWKKVRGWRREGLVHFDIWWFLTSG